MLYADWLHGSEDLSMARAVRHKVFVEEQNIPEEIEYDEQDGMAWHLLVLDEDGRITKVFWASVTHEDLKTEVEKALK